MSESLKAPTSTALSVLRQPRTALILLVLCSLSLHLFLALSHENYWGVDGGAYLLSRNAVLGDEPTGQDISRPLLAPGWQLVPFTAALGDDAGYKLWSAIAATFPVLAVYLLARLFLSRWWAIFAAAFLSIDMLQAEMFVTGALPLEGFSLIAIGLWAITKLWRFGEAHWKHMLVLAVTIPVLAHTNHTSAGLALILFPLYMVALSVFSTADDPGTGGFRWWGRILATPFAQFPTMLALGVGSLIALTALPYYLAVHPIGGVLDHPGRILYLSSWPDSAWFQFAIAAPIAYWLVRYGQNPVIRAFGVLVGVLGVLLTLLSTDETIINLFYRSRYLIAFFIYPAAAWLTYRYWWPAFKGRYKTIAWASMLLVAGLLGWEYIRTVEGQSAYSDMVTPSTAQALSNLRESPTTTGQDGIVSNSFTLSLWVAALNRVSSPHPWTWTPPPRFQTSDTHVRCVLGWVQGCSAEDAARDLGVGYVLIDTRFPYYSPRAPGNYLAPPDQWTVTAEAPWLTLVYDEATTKVWRID